MGCPQYSKASQYRHTQMPRPQSAVQGQYRCSAGHPLFLGWLAGSQDVRGRWAGWWTPAGAGLHGLLTCAALLAAGSHVAKPSTSGIKSRTPAAHSRVGHISRQTAEGPGCAEASSTLGVAAAGHQQGTSRAAPLAGGRSRAHTCGQNDFLGPPLQGWAGSRQVARGCTGRCW